MDPIGTETTNFIGTYDGCGRKISNITISTSTSAQRTTGLFGSVGNGGVIKNIDLVDASITCNSSTTNSVGGIVGWLSGTVQGCSVTGTTSVTNSYYGGVGGIVGDSSGTVQNCYSTGNVIGNNSNATAGGIAGYTSGGTISKCYFAGSLSGTATMKGGIVANKWSGTVNNNFFLSTSAAYGLASVAGSSGSNEGAAPTTDANLKLQSTFKEPASEEWDFTSAWYINEGNAYPVLRAPAPYASDITINSTTSVTATSLVEGDNVYVYDASSGGTLLGSATVTSGNTSAAITIPELTASSGSLYVSIKSAFRPEGDRATKNYATPGTPTNVTASPDNGQVTLNWTGDDIATGYKIFVGTASGSYSSTPDATVAAVTSTTITGLTNGTTYYFVVRAFSSVGESSNSTEISAIPRYQITDLAATAGNAQVDLTWTAVTGAASVVLYQSTDGVNFTATPVSLTSASTSATVTGLTNLQKYYFKLVAIVGGTEADCNEVNATPYDPATVASYTATKCADSYGDSATAYVGCYGGSQENAAVQFDITGYNTTKTIESAIVKLYFDASQSTGTGSFDFYGSSDDDWGTSLTDMPASWEITALYTDQTGFSSTGWYSFDVTDYVKANISASDTTFSFVLVGSNTGGSDDYGFTRCNGSSNQPYISVVFGATPAASVSASAAAGSPSAGADNTVTLTVKDSWGNIDTTFAGDRMVTVTGYEAAPDGTYGSFGGTLLEADGSTDVSVSYTDGVGTSSLALNKADEQTIGFSVSEVTAPNASVTITPVPATAASMELTQDITAPASNGGQFAQQPKVTLKDTYGNTCTNDSTTEVTVSKKDAGSWTLTGTVTVTASSGTVTFTDLGATNEAQVDNAQMAFNATGLTEATSTTVTLPAPVGAQTATAAAATAGPVAGADNEITLTVKNALGNTDTGFNGAADVTISGYTAALDGSCGSFNGTVLTASPNTISVTFAGGVATPNLVLNNASAQTIGFSIAGVATPATNTVSITPVPAAAASMVLTRDIQAPTTNGGQFAQQPEITLKDTYGNPCTNDSATEVTASKKDAGSWTLTGTVTVTASSGTVTFTDLGATNEAQVDNAQMAFNATGLTEATSTTVTLPAPVGAQTATASAETLTPTAGANNEVTLTVKNVLGNTDTTFNGAADVTVSGYTAAPDSSCGSFNGTTLTASPNTISVTFTGGVAMSNLVLNNASAQTIGFSIAGVATPATNTVSITPVPATAASMVLTQDITAPATNGGQFAQQPSVTLKDTYGNPCTNDSVTEVTAFKKDAGSWTLTGTVTVTASSGTVTFTDLGATNEAQVDNAQMAFNATGLTEVTSTTVTLPAPASAQTATAAAVTAGPVAGANDAITLTVKDSLGNTDTTFNGAADVTVSGYTAAPDGSCGSFNGTTLTASPNTISVTFTGGVATPNLVLNNASAQTIGFSIAGVTTPATNTVSITPVPAAAASMALTQDITAAAANGGQFAQQPEVTLKDTYGNTCTNDSVTEVTASKKDAGSWTLTGTVKVTASSGTVTFTDLGTTNAAAVTGAQLAFDAGALSQITSSAVNLPAPALASDLAITTTSLPSGTAGTSYSATLTASGGTAPYTWSAAGLPLGLNLDTVSGQVYGTPASAGTSIVSAAVYDSAADSDSASFSLTVNPASPGLTITTTSLPGGRVGTSYSATLTASGGTAPYTWSAAGLPLGLNLDTVSGQVYGTPTSAGTSTVSTMVYDSAGASASASFSLTISHASSNGGNKSGTSTTQQAGSSDSNVEIMVNGKIEGGSATASTITVGDRTVTTVVLDPQKLEEKLKQEGENTVVTIPVSTKADTVIGQLNGQMVKSMEQKSAVVEIKTENASYTLPAAQINIDDVAAQLGQNVELEDINVNIEIARSPDGTVQFVEDAAEKNNYTIVVPPVDFKVTCTYEDKTVEVKSFNAFVERTIAIPEGIDPQKITTAVSMNSDGTLTHVPTKIIVRDGKYYAVVNSLTNSTYTVIWHPKTFKDVENHWAKDYVNEMGSRLVVSGVDENNYSPDRDVTRAEFAAIIVRALGLGEKGEKNNFRDVTGNDWFNGAVSTAYEYGIINGYNDGTFSPNKAISREEAMVVIAGAAKLAGINADIAGADVDAQLAGFKDNGSLDSWARNSAAACVKSGIIVGDNSMLTPDDNITRAQAATIVMRMLQKANLI
ncbi:S-layer homology domain-containing protein [Pelotomaculum sp. FP]|uniref:S-layer homology domain-containing protein n=1 Tax=Pelotomaculum sp. FP TaxID=261474 RepID=UPI001864629B|nr:S-layer homology domain-containing protein [Pelotomaculum sp. FP]